MRVSGFLSRPVIEQSGRFSIEGFFNPGTGVNSFSFGASGKDYYSGSGTASIGLSFSNGRVMDPNNKFVSHYSRNADNSYLLSVNSGGVYDLWVNKNLVVAGQQHSDQVYSYDKLYTHSVGGVVDIDMDMRGETPTLSFLQNSSITGCDVSIPVTYDGPQVLKIFSGSLVSNSFPPPADVSFTGYPSAITGSGNLSFSANDTGVGSGFFLYNLKTNMGDFVTGHTYTKNVSGTGYSLNIYQKGHNGFASVSNPDNYYTVKLRKTNVDITYLDAKLLHVGGSGTIYETVPCTGSGSGYFSGNIIGLGLLYGDNLSGSGNYLSGTLAPYTGSANWQSGNGYLSYPASGNTTYYYNTLATGSYLTGVSTGYISGSGVFNVGTGDNGVGNFTGYVSGTPNTAYMGGVAIGTPTGSYLGYVSLLVSGTGYYSTYAASGNYTGYSSISRGEKTFTGSWNLKSGSVISNLESYRQKGWVSGNAYDDDPYTVNTPVLSDNTAIYLDVQYYNKFRNSPMDTARIVVSTNVSSGFLDISGKY